MTAPIITRALRWRRVFAFVVLAFALAAPVHNACAAYTPDDDGVVLQAVPSPAGDTRVRNYLALRANYQANPDNAELAEKLAHAYIDFGRQTGDIRYLGFAEAVIKPWIAKTPPSIGIQLVEATILQSRHQFAAARKALTALLKRDPGNAQAWLTLATVALVQGDVDESNQACVHTTNTGGIFLGLACTAQLRIATGQAGQAYAVLSQIANGGKVVPDDIQAWTQGLLGEAAWYNGNENGAKMHFQKGLALTPGDNFLLADYADFLLDHNQPAAVIELLQDHTQSDTSFLRLVLAEAALDKLDAKRDTWTMAARFAAMDLAGSHLYRREQSRFVLHLQHDPKQALKLAQQNWQAQRAPWDVRIYLEAALAAERPQAAQPVLDFIARTHVSTPKIDALVQQINTALVATPATSTAP